MSDQAEKAPLPASGIRFPAGTSAEDVAVVVALLAAGADAAAPAGPATAPSLWAAPRRAVRRPTSPGAFGWWTSQLP